MDFPETQSKLIARLPGGIDSTDESAWEDFVSTYAPFIAAYARRRGLQESDCEELVQRVLLSVSKAIANWRREPGKPPFRSWLFTIARNHLISMLRSDARLRRVGVAGGGSTHLQVLNESPAESEDPRQAEALNYQREGFLWAAEQVRESVQASSWRAFWLTAIQGQSCPVVAKELGMEVGSVYAARSRILKKIKSLVSLYEPDSQSSSTEPSSILESR